MTVKTLEQELEDAIASNDYRVRLASSSYLHVHVIYWPSVRSVDMGGKIPLLVANGEIGMKLFAGPARWRYWRARRFVRRTIEGHRKLIVEGARIL